MDSQKWTADCEVSQHIHTHMMGLSMGSLWDALQLSTKVTSKILDGSVCSLHDIAAPMTYQFKYTYLPDQMTIHGGSRYSKDDSSGAVVYSRDVPDLLD